MVYIISRGILEGSIVLVKAASKEEVKKRLSLRDGEQIVGQITTDELSALYNANFAVITA